MDGYVYLATDGELFKIGRTIDPEQRVSGLKNTARGELRNASIKMLHFFPCDNMVEAERILHSLLSSKRKRGEWFDLSEEDVARITSIKAGDSSVFTDEVKERANQPDDMKTVTLRLSAALDRRMEIYATLKGIKKQDAVKQAFEMFLDYVEE